MFKRLLERLRQDVSEVRADNIRAWAERQRGVTLISEVEPRTVAKVAGVVKTLRIVPRDSSHSFEADITDGTGTATASWLGRRTIPGLSIGVRVLVEGRMGGEPGRLVVVNPAYEFAPGEH